MGGAFIKHKILIFVVFGFAFCILFSLPVFAWVPSRNFYCQITTNSIPENAIYVDMLLPINETDDNYISINESNCKKYNINSSSEIVTYNQDGYKSYTFHIKDSESEIGMNINYFFKIKENENVDKLYRALGDYKKYLQELNNYNKTNYIDNDGDLNYNLNFNLFSNEYYKFWNTFSKNDFDSFREYDFSTVTFNSRDITDSDGVIIGRKTDKYDLQYYCKLYKTVKFAYLDINGNILGISNEATIYKKSISLPQLDLSLDGNTLTCKMSYGPPFWILPILALSFVLLVIIAIIVLLFLFINNKRRKIYECKKSNLLE